jgi:hypothetical protein
VPYQRVDNSERWSPDADIRLADWVKTRWTLPTTIDDFLPVLQRRNNAQTFEQYQQSLDGFMMLPVSDAMPDSLRADLLEAGFTFSV